MEDEQKNFTDDITTTLSFLVASIVIIGIFLAFIKQYTPTLTLTLSTITTAIFTLTRKNWKLDKSWNTFILTLLIATQAFIMLSGTFAYPWLENSDPYDYGVTAQSLTAEKTFIKQHPNLYVSNYAAPNAIGYSITIATLQQIFKSMNYTLKIVNALIIILTTAMFYTFTKNFTNKTTALAATFIIISLPSFLTHFIFATPLAILFLIASLHYLNKEEPTNATIFITALFLTHHLISAFFIILLIPYILLKKQTKPLKPIIAATAISGIYWTYQLLIYGFKGIATHLGILDDGGKGTITTQWTLKHFFFPTTNNTTNISHGIGLGIMILLITGILIFIARKQKTTNQKITITWLIISLTGLLSVYLPISFMSFRWWTILSIPTAIIAGDALATITQRKEKYIFKITALLLILTVILTSFLVKAQINTIRWSPSESLSDPAIMNGMLYIKQNLPQNTHIFSFHTAGKFQGFDMYTCEWCLQEYEYKKHLPTRIDILSAKLQTWNYEYLIITPKWYTAKYGQEATIQFIKNIQTSTNYFKLVGQTNELQLYQIIPINITITPIANNTIPKINTTKSTTTTKITEVKL